MGGGVPLTRFMHSPYTESGQAALIVVLASVVILTLGIGAVARSTVDIRLSAQTHEAAAAFAAAEAGIESGLLNKTSGTWQLTPTPPGIASAIYTVTGLPDLSSYDLGSVRRGDAKTVWLVNDVASPFTSTHYVGDVTVEWDPDTAEMEAITYYISGSEVMGSRTVIDSGDQITFNSGDSPIDDQWIALRLKPIMEDMTNITISDYNGSFPVQGYRVESNGYTSSGINRRIVVHKWHDDVPGIFDFTIMGNSRLIKS